MPGKIAHWLIKLVPSICALPFMKRPWKCKEVDWFVREFETLTSTLSPTAAWMVGGGHFPLTPMSERGWKPSGLVQTQATSKSYLMTALEADVIRRAVQSANVKAIGTMDGSLHM